VKDCCEIADVPREQRRVLLVVFWINTAMFLAEFGAGVLADSTALLADSVDMLGDAIVYGFSLYVVSRSIVWKARASLLKGIVMAGFAVGVLAEALVKLARGGVPNPEIIGWVGLVALAANLSYLFLLWGRRSDDINMRSAWLCSLNDAVGNVGVLVAAAGVSITSSVWPDVGIGLAIAAMFGASAVRGRRAGQLREPFPRSAEAANVRCDIELLEGPRPSVADYVRGPAATRGAIAASVAYAQISLGDRVGTTRSGNE
jgi:Co/Zn/Cd efflux system component